MKANEKTFTEKWCKITETLSDIKIKGSELEKFDEIEKRFHYEQQN